MLSLRLTPSGPRPSITVATMPTFGISPLHWALLVEQRKADPTQEGTLEYLTSASTLVAGSNSCSNMASGRILFDHLQVPLGSVPAE